MKTPPRLIIKIKKIYSNAKEAFPRIKLFSRRETKKMKNGILLATIVFSCALSLAASPSRAADSAKGQEVYNTYCALCHGPTGLGDGVGAAALDPKPRDLSSAAILETYTDEYLVNVITNGGMAVGKSPAMPPWGGVVSPEDIENVVAHIRQNLCKCEYKK